MGVFDTKQSDTPAPQPVPKEHTLQIHLPGRAPEETVTVRTKVSPDDKAWVTKQFSHQIASYPKMSTAARLKLADRLFIHRLIESWTLTQEGQLLALDPEMESNARWETICALPQSEQDSIYLEIMKRQRGELGGTPHLSPELRRAVQSRGKR